MQWLNKLFDKLLSLWPCVYILAPYEAGVRFTFGKRSRAKDAGWYLVWPIVQKFVVMEVQTQVVDLRTQSVSTAGDKDVVVSGAIQYRITDIEKAVCNVQSLDGSLETLALGIILDFVNRKTMQELSDVDALKGELRKGMADACSGWGVKIERVYITDLGHTRNIRLLMNPTTVGDSDE
jgi:regulator of protease activity HflC (stomatin/prohibitin superfamily)